MPPCVASTFFSFHGFWEIFAVLGILFGSEKILSSKFFHLIIFLKEFEVYISRKLYNN